MAYGFISLIFLLYYTGGRVGVLKSSVQTLIMNLDERISVFIKNVITEIKFLKISVARAPAQVGPDSVTLLLISIELIVY